MADIFKIRESIMALAIDQEKKLREHDGDRGERGWFDEDVMWLLHRVIDEAEELRLLLLNVRECQGADAIMELAQDARLECADAANFLMMIHDNLGDMCKDD